jgi:hypothetical protein
MAERKIAKKNIKIDDDLIEELEIVQNQYTGT